MDGISEVFLQYGVLGASVLVLGIVVGVLYRDNKKLNEDKLTLMNEKVALVEARRLDAVENTTKLLTVLQENSQNNAILAAKISVGKSTSGRDDR